MSPLDDFVSQLGPAQVLTAPEDIAPYARDWTGRYAAPPRAVLRPADTAQVAASLRACAAAGLAVVPAGGRTGLCGGAVVRADGPPAVVLSLERMNRVRNVGSRDFSITVDAGCTVRAVQMEAEAVDRLFPLSFGAEGTAQIGGALSTNAGGIRTIRWGNARDLVLGIEVVLPDGRVLDDLRRVRKDNTGYALRHLFLGGEGTLGVITGAALKLAPALRARETAFLSVPSPAAALALLGRLVSNGAELIGFELICRWPLELVRRHGARARLPFALESPWYVLLELGTAAAGADLRTPLETRLATAIDAGEAGEVVIAESEEQRAGLWYLREVMPECNRAEAPSVSADTAVPVSAVPSFLAQVEAAFAARWPEGRLIAVGHAGDGNVHISLQAPRGTPREVWLRNAEAIEDTVNRIAVAHGGSFSAEHGIGQSKRHAMAALRDPVALDLMRAIKAAIDPRGMMNPGKMLPGWRPAMPTGNEGRVLLVPPGGGEEHWQPQPANGWISILAAPEVANAPRGVSVGLQELPPLGKIREHAHPAQDEYFYFLEGEGLARLDGVVRRIRRGSFLFAGAHARHGFINDGDVPFRFLWLLAPAGLEAFFRAIGRPRTADGPDPTPYPRPADIGAIELATVFETLDPPPPPPWDSVPITDPAVLAPLRRAAV